MSIIFLTASIAFFLWTGRNILFWVHLWQLKEYRFDRMFAHLTETYQGKNVLFSPLLYLKIFAILLFGFVAIYYEYLRAYEVFVTCIFCVQLIFLTKEIANRTLRRPVITFKSVGIITISFFFAIILYLLPFLDQYLWLLIIDRLLVFFIGFIVFLLAIPTEFYRDIQVQRAMKKLAAHKDLLVIGITGSYGKSSTKEFVAELLRQKFSVLKTSGTNNTPIGIAATILTSLRKDTQILVVEMGAYKKGEIEQISKIVSPKIGILTGINDQHLSLFGSIEDTMTAKYELIKSLPKDGLALFNGNNPLVYSLYKKTSKRKVLYSTMQSSHKRKPEGEIITASSIVVSKRNVSFIAKLPKKTMHLEVPLIGAQNVENMLPALYLGSYLGMSAKEIKEAVTKLLPLPKTMVSHPLQSGATVLDDTFNANSDAVLSVLSYMKIYKGKKILVLHPIVELGSRGKKQHYELAKRISTICDYLFMTNKNFSNEIIQGVKDGGGPCSVHIGNLAQAVEFIAKTTKKGDIVVCEGKEAGIVLHRIL